MKKRFHEENFEEEEEEGLKWKTREEGTKW
jgi:hypothetical protein